MRVKCGPGQMEIEFVLATVSLIYSEGRDDLKFCLLDLYLVIMCPFDFN